jgi:hypothetical protein
MMTSVRSRISLKSPIVPLCVGKGVSFCCMYVTMIRMSGRQSGTWRVFVHAGDEGVSPCGMRSQAP